jgi:hypothetical protein
MNKYLSIFIIYSKKGKKCGFRLPVGAWQNIKDLINNVSDTLLNLNRAWDTTSFSSAQDTNLYPVLRMLGNRNLYLVVVSERWDMPVGKTSLVKVYQNIRAQQKNTEVFCSWHTRYPYYPVHSKGNHSFPFVAVAPSIGAQNTNNGRAST